MKDVLFKGFRIILYGGYLLALSLIFLEDAKSTLPQKFSETSLTEYFQEGTFLLIVLCFAYYAMTKKSSRKLSVFLAGFYLMPFIREMDAWLDANVFDGAWQTLVLIVLLFLVYFSFKNWKTLIQEFMDFTVSYPFGIMVTGFLVTFAYSRLFGEAIMWETVMEEQYMRSVKNAAEESVELMGDTLILFSVIEYGFWSKKSAIGE